MFQTTNSQPAIIAATYRQKIYDEFCEHLRNESLTDKFSRSYQDVLKQAYQAYQSTQGGLRHDSL